jgi:hypothetical protein
MEKNDKTFLCEAGGKKDFGVKIGERLTFGCLTDCFLSAIFTMQNRLKMESSRSSVAVLPTFCVHGSQSQSDTGN